MDQIAPKIFKVGFNPLVYKDSGLKALCSGVLLEPRAKARGNSIVIFLNSYSYKLNLTAIGFRGRSGFYKSEKNFVNSINLKKLIVIAPS